MVQDRSSLEALVLQAWRERWTEIEWSVALKAALAEDNSEVDKLCWLLIKTATLSEVPNKLLFNYLSFTVASQVVSHASLLQAVIEYSDFHKELCIEAILDVLKFVRERLNCPTGDVYQCQCVCKLLTKLLIWFMTALDRSIQNPSAKLVSELVTAAMAFVYNPFVAICLYFGKLEDADTHAELRNRANAVSQKVTSLDWISDSYKQDFRVFVNRIDNISQVLGDVNATLSSDPVPHPTVISLAVLYGSVSLAEPIEAPIAALKHVREVQQLPWFQVIRDFIRGSLLLQQDSTSSVPDSHLTAFVYLRIPRLIYELIECDAFAKEDLRDALIYVVRFDSLFNSMDMKSRCDCFCFFLYELTKLQLLSDYEAKLLRDIRTGRKGALTDASPGNQANITLVLKAEPTLQTILKSFHSGFAQQKDRLVQMMHHMISGKSFEFICAAAAATGQLSTFTGRLIDFNESTKRPEKSDEVPADALIRSALFDLSFCLLSRVVHLHGCAPVSQNAHARGSFFESWCAKYVDIGRQGRRSSGTAIGACSSARDAQKGELGDESLCDEEGVDYSATEIIRQLKSQQEWITNIAVEWNVICERVPEIGECLLAEINADQITQEELKCIFSGLVLPTTTTTTSSEQEQAQEQEEEEEEEEQEQKLKQELKQEPEEEQEQEEEQQKQKQKQKQKQTAHWMCSLLLCMAQWLVSCTASEDRRRLAVALNAFIESNFVQGIERTKNDRQTFMSNMTKRLLAPLLAPTPVPSPPYPWLNSVRRQVHCQQPVVTGCSLPTLDTMRHYLSGALKQGWLSSSALLIIERCQKLGEQKLWIRMCFDELSKLSATEELNLWCDISMACCYVDPAGTLIHFVEMLALFVLEPGRELFCVAPRGASLSRLLVQLYLLGFRCVASERRNSDDQQPGQSSSSGDEPDNKLRKIDSTLEAASGHEWTKFRDALSNALANLYRRFCTICDDGDLRPAVFFVGTFLKCLAEYHTSEARRMMNELPPHLVGLLIRTDPRILTPSTVLALSDLNEKSQRQRALLNLCLLRHLKAL